MSWKSIGGGSIGIAIIALILSLNYNVTDLTYYCDVSPGKLMECPYGLSSGLNTRCYLNPGKTSWDNCATGWKKAKDYIQEVPYTGNAKIVNGWKTIQDDTDVKFILSEDNSSYLFRIDKKKDFSKEFSFKSSKNIAVYKKDKSTGNYNQVIVTQDGDKYLIEGKQLKSSDIGNEYKIVKSDIKEGDKLYLGSGTEILVYTEDARINYVLPNGVSTDITLRCDNTNVNEIFVSYDYDRYKIGANISGEDRLRNCTYTVDSTDKLVMLHNMEDNITFPYVYNYYPEGNMERQEIYSFKDICNKDYADCKWNITNNVFIVNFKSYNNVDPDIYNTSACATLSASGVYTLNQSLTTTGDCLVVTAPNVEINLAGYSISGDNSGGTDYGIVGYYADNLTIMNGNISGFAGNAINLRGSSNVKIYNNTIYGTSAGTSAYGIGWTVTDASANINISDNYIERYYYGIGTPVTGVSIINPTLQNNIFSTSTYSYRPYGLGGSVKIIGNKFLGTTTECIYTRTMLNGGVESIYMANNYMGGSTCQSQFDLQSNVLVSFLVENNTFAQAAGSSVSTNYGKNMIVRRNQFIPTATTPYSISLSGTGSCNNVQVYENNFTKPSFVYINQLNTQTCSNNSFRDNKINGTGANGIFYASNVLYTGFNISNNIFNSTSQTLLTTFVNLNHTLDFNNNYIGTGINPVTTYFAGNIRNNIFDIGSNYIQSSNQYPTKIFNNTIKLSASSYAHLIGGGTTIDNLLIENNTYSGTTSTTFYIYNNQQKNIVIRNNDFNKLVSSTCINFAGFATNISNITIENNNFTCSGTSISTSITGTQLTDDSIIIKDNIFNQTSGIGYFLHANANRIGTLQNNKIVGVNQSYGTAMARIFGQLNYESLGKFIDQPLWYIDIITTPFKYKDYDSNYGGIEFNQYIINGEVVKSTNISEEYYRRNGGMDVSLARTRGSGVITVVNPANPTTLGYAKLNASDYNFGTGAFTIQFWGALQTDGLDAAGTYLGITQGDLAHSYITMIHQDTTGKLGLYSGVIYSNEQVIKSRKWHLITVTRNSTGANSAMLCVDKNCKIGTIGNNFNNVGYYIIGNSGSAAWIGKPSIDNFRVYNKYMTQNEVENNFDLEENGKEINVTTNLMNEFKFDNSFYDTRNNRTWINYTPIPATITLPMDYSYLDGIVDYSIRVLNTTHPISGDWSIGGWYNIQNLQKKQNVMFYGTENNNQSIYANIVAQTNPDNSLLNIYQYGSSIPILIANVSSYGMKLYYLTYESSTSTLRVYDSGIEKNSTVINLDLQRDQYRMGRTFSGDAPYDLKGIIANNYIFSKLLTGAQINQTFQAMSNGTPKEEYLTDITDYITQSMSTTQRVGIGYKYHSKKIYTATFYNINASLLSEITPKINNISCYQNLCDNAVFDSTTKTYNLDVYADGNLTITITDLVSPSVEAQANNSLFTYYADVRINWSITDLNLNTYNFNITNATSTIYQNTTSSTGQIILYNVTNGNYQYCANGYDTQGNYNETCSNFSVLNMGDVYLRIIKPTGTKFGSKFLTSIETGYSFISYLYNINGTNYSYTPNQSINFYSSGEADLYIYGITNLGVVVSNYTSLDLLYDGYTSSIYNCLILGSGCYNGATPFGGGISAAEVWNYTSRNLTSQVSASDVWNYANRTLSESSSVNVTAIANCVWNEDGSSCTNYKEIDNIR